MPAICPRVSPLLRESHRTAPRTAHLDKAVALISLDEADRAHARRVVDALGGDKQRAAEILGVSRATLYRLLSVKTNQADSAKA